MKTNHPNTILAFAFIFLLIACKQAKPENGADHAVTPKESTAFPFLGNEELTNLYARAEKSDMIFYDLPISVNQDEAASAKNSVLYISPAPAGLNQSCKPSGRIMWMADGDIIREADIYMDSLCYYFIFMTDNKPVAANAMSEPGITFFKNLVTQVQQRTQ